MAKEVENEKAADFAKFNLKIIVVDIWQFVNSAGDDIDYKSLSDEVKKSQRRSMAVGPLEDLPPHLRNHLVRFT